MAELVYRYNLDRKLTSAEADGNITELAARSAANAAATADLGEVVAGIGESVAGIIENLADLEENQNNTTQWRPNFWPYETPPTEAEVVDYINEFLTFEVTPIQSRVYIRFFAIVSGVYYTYIFDFGGGNGTWGANLEEDPGILPVTVSRIKLISMFPTVPSEIEDNDDTIIVELGAVAAGGFLAAANLASHDFSDTDVQYYFSYYIDSVLYLALFIGAPGVYGGGGMPFVDADFAQVTNSEVTPAPGLNDVALVNNQSDVPLVVADAGLSQKLSHKADRLTLIRPELPDEDFILNPDIEEEQQGKRVVRFEDLDVTRIPTDFFISCTYNPLPVGGSLISYVTDEIRQIDINPMVGDYGVYTARDVDVIDDETIIVIGERFDGVIGAGSLGENNYYVLALRGCRIVKNVLTVGSYEVGELTGIKKDASNVPYNLHSFIYHRGFMYGATRVTSTVVDNTQVVKVNPWDLKDIKYLELPTTGDYNCSVGQLRAYKNNIYLLGVKSTTPRSSSLIRVDETLQDYEVLFVCGNVTGAKRLVNSTPFLIYNDKVIIPYINILAETGDATSAYNTVGFFVFDLFKKTLLTDTGAITITTGATAHPIPHWMSVFNDKIIMHTSSGTSNRVLVRFNAKTFSFEEDVPLPWGITNENSITRDGYVLLNPELTYFQKLIKVKYNDFTDYSEISPEGWYSLGSYDWNKVYPESLKTKLSEFENDIGSGTQEWPWVAYTQTPVWNSSAPTGSVNANWTATRMGRVVIVSITSIATTAANNNNVFIPLPAGLPAPSAAPGYSANGDHFGAASGYLMTDTNATPAGARATVIKSPSGVYGVNIMAGTTLAKGFTTTFQYWAD